MKKKKEKSEYFLVKKENVKTEWIISKYDIHIYLEKSRSFILSTDSKKEAKTIVSKLWETGVSDTLRVEVNQLVAISIIPKKKCKYWFEKADTI